MAAVKMPIQNEVVQFRDGFAVVWGGRVCSPRWPEKGLALAYLSLLETGYRKPE